MKSYIETYINYKIIVLFIVLLIQSTICVNGQIFHKTGFPFYEFAFTISLNADEVVNINSNNTVVDIYYVKNVVETDSSPEKEIYRKTVVIEKDNFRLISDTNALKIPPQQLPPVFLDIGEQFSYLIPHHFNYQSGAFINIDEDDDKELVLIYANMSESNYGLYNDGDAFMSIYKKNNKKWIKRQTINCTDIIIGPLESITALYLSQSHYPALHIVSSMDIKENVDKIHSLIIPTQKDSNKENNLIRLRTLKIK